MQIHCHLARHQCYQMPYGKIHSSHCVKESERSKRAQLPAPPWICGAIFRNAPITRWTSAIVAAGWLHNAKSAKIHTAVREVTNQSNLYLQELPVRHTHRKYFQQHMMKLDRKIAIDAETMRCGVGHKRADEIHYDGVQETDMANYSSCRPHNTN